MFHEFSGAFDDSEGPVGGLIGGVVSGTSERHAPASENRGPESIPLADRLTVDHVSELGIHNIDASVLVFPQKDSYLLCSS